MIAMVTGVLGGFIGTVLGGYALYLTYTTFGDDSDSSKVLAYTIITLAIVAFFISYIAFVIESVMGGAMSAIF